jgi:hypothetical protein
MSFNLTVDAAYAVAHAAAEKERLDVEAAIEYWLKKIETELQSFITSEELKMDVRAPNRQRDFPLQFFTSYNHRRCEGEHLTKLCAVINARPTSGFSAERVGLDVLRVRWLQPVSPVKQ